MGSCSSNLRGLLAARTKHAVITTPATSTVMASITAQNTFASTRTGRHSPTSSCSWKAGSQSKPKQSPPASACAGSGSHRAWS